MSKESALALLTTTPTPPAILSSVPAGSPIITEPAQAAPASELPSTPMAHFAKKEQEYVRKMQEFKKEQEAVAKEKEQIKKIKDEYDRWQSTKATDPINALKQLGFTESDIFNYMAAQQPVDLSPEQKAAKAAEEATSKKIAEFEENQLQKLREEQKRSDATLLQNYRNEISKGIKTGGDKYEYCAYYGAQAEDLIFETVKAVAKESGEAMDPKEALELVEKYYEDEDKAMSIHIKKRTPKTPEPPQPESKISPPTRSRTLVEKALGDQPAPKPTLQKTRTLHQGTTATVAAMRQTRNETISEKRARLIEKLRNGG